jgi:beta-glucanase (GH16 family)
MRKLFYPLMLIGFAITMSILPLASVQAGAGSLILDFENGIPFSVDAYNNGLGFVPWGNAFENVILSARQVLPGGKLALPNGEDRSNTVLAVNYDIAEGGWGGFTYVFNDGVNWTSDDWSHLGEFDFEFYGSNTGEQIQIDLFDNRNPKETGDSAERWYYRIDDNVEGWRSISIPFGLFQRRTDFQPSGAPDDGLGLNQVSGFAFGFPAGVGPQTVYIDNVWVATTTHPDEVEIIGEEPMSEAASQPDTITWDSRQWDLIWSDEFDGPAGTPIDSNSWTCEIGGQGWGNQEHEYYTPLPENVSLDGNSSLAIVARQETPEVGHCWYGTCQYTSARCITQNKVEFTYGRVEARIKIPYGQGIWPAFWLLGGNIKQVGWPNSGEIDIMENIGKEPKIVHGTVHGPQYSGSGIGAPYTIDKNFADDFHVYAIDWDTDAIRWYADGNLYNKFTPDDLGNRKWVFDHDFFILLNLAVGGLWPGYPDETTTFPQTMLVDYVRVYQLAGQKEG